MGVVDEGDLWWPGWVYDMPLCALILQQKTAASSSGGGGGGGGRQNNATDRTELLGGDSWEVNREAQPACGTGMALQYPDDSCCAVSLPAPR